jgi:hypothetical protein
LVGLLSRKEDYAMNYKLKKSVQAAVAVAVLFTLLLLLATTPEKAVLVGVTGGILIGGSVYFFFAPSQKPGLGNDHKGELENGERIVMQEGASHIIKGEDVGGMLFLTDKSLIFQSHTFSLRKHQLILPLDEFADVEIAELYGHVKSGIKVTLVSGQIEKFRMKSFERWAERLDEFVLEHD